MLADLPTGPLGEAATKDLLRAYGVPVNAGRVATSPDDAVTAAETIGYPVALKVAAAELSHKSDLGGVALGLADAGAVRAAWERLAANVARHAPGTSLDGMLVQAMVAGEAELIVGARRDPHFGPVVLVGAGGILVEVLNDVQLALAPIGPQAALALLRRLRSWPLLGECAGDRRSTARRSPRSSAG